MLSHLKDIIHSSNPTTSNSSNFQSDNSTMTHAAIYFQKDMMYQHSILQVNYTTYDVRQSQDTLNPKTDHRDILFLSSEPQMQESTAHQYQYA